MSNPSCANPIASRLLRAHTDKHFLRATAACRARQSRLFSSTPTGIATQAPFQQSSTRQIWCTPAYRRFYSIRNCLPQRLAPVKMTPTPQSQSSGDTVTTRTYFMINKQETISSRSKSPKSPTKKSDLNEEPEPFPIPSPSDDYVTRAAEPPTVLKEPRRLFVVLDLNRTLIYRPAAVGQFIRRPYLDQFMETIVRDHNAMIWTTSKPDTVKNILPKAFKGRVRRKLCEVWDRKSFGMTKQQYLGKTQVYKELDKIWGQKTLQRKREEQTKVNRKKLPQTKIIRDFWNQSNTVLVDDSWQKGLAQPFNLLEVPALRDSNVDDDFTLPAILRQLRILSHYSDVSCKIRQWITRRDKIFRPHADGTPFVLAQKDYNWFWSNVLSFEEEKLGLEPYEFPKRYAKGGAVSDSDSEASDDNEIDAYIRSN